MTYPTSTHGFTPRVPVILNVKDLCVSGTPQTLPTASLSHRIHGTGIFTYQFTIKPTIHVGKSPVHVKCPLLKGPIEIQRIIFLPRFFQATCYFSGDNFWKESRSSIGPPNSAAHTAILHDHDLLRQTHGLSVTSRFAKLVFILWTSLMVPSATCHWIILNWKSSI